MKHAFEKAGFMTADERLRKIIENALSTSRNFEFVAESVINIINSDSSLIIALCGERAIYDAARTYLRGPTAHQVAGRTGHASDDAQFKIARPLPHTKAPQGASGRGRVKDDTQSPRAPAGTNTETPAQPGGSGHTGRDTQIRFSTPNTLPKHAGQSISDTQMMLASVASEPHPAPVAGAEASDEKTPKAALPPLKFAPPPGSAMLADACIEFPAVTIPFGINLADAKHRDLGVAETVLTRRLSSATRDYRVASWGASIIKSGTMGDQRISNTDITTILDIVEQDNG